jgi:predicted nucleic acid-binding protein
MISFMTVAELDRWVLEARWGETRRQRLREYLERFVVLPYDRDLCTKWAEVTVRRFSLRCCWQLPEGSCRGTLKL